MNLPSNPPTRLRGDIGTSINAAYRYGCRDIRHAAAEIAVSADARIERLEKALRELVKCNEDHNATMQQIIGKPVGWNDSYLDAARAALNHE